MTKQFYLTMRMIFANARHSKEPCKVFYVNFTSKRIAIPPRIEQVN